MNCPRILPDLQLMLTLYDDFLEPVCRRHHLSRMQMDVLLFLANNPQINTAAQICRIRKIPKSSLSVALNGLVENHLVKREYQDGNRKELHLFLLPASKAPVLDGQNAQQAFWTLLCQDCSIQQLENLEDTWKQFVANATRKLEEKQC